MPPRSKNSRIQLGEPLQSKLADFRAANYDAPEIQVIREALEEHIERRLEEPEIRKRFDQARKLRLEGEGKVANLKPVK